MLETLSPADIAIKFGLCYDTDFAVRFYLDPAKLFLVERALRADRKIDATDGECELWATFETREFGRWTGLAVNYEGSIHDGNRPYFEINGEVWGEGDDYFDYTRPAAELGLTERLVVASIARRVFAAADAVLAELAP